MTSEHGQFTDTLQIPANCVERKLLRNMVRPGGFELPTFWFVANGVKMLNALFGVAYGLETPFFPHLAAPNSAPKTEMYRPLHEFNPTSRIRASAKGF